MACYLPVFAYKLVAMYVLGGAGKSYKILEFQIGTKASLPQA